MNVIVLCVLYMLVFYLLCVSCMYFINCMEDPEDYCHSMERVCYSTVFEDRMWNPHSIWAILHLNVLLTHVCSLIFMNMIVLVWPMYMFYFVLYKVKETLIFWIFSIKLG